MVEVKECPNCKLACIGETDEVCPCCGEPVKEEA